jgi:hypothetical protein
VKLTRSLGTITRNDCNNLASDAKIAHYSKVSENIRLEKADRKIKAHVMLLIDTSISSLTSKESESTRDNSCL